MIVSKLIQWGIVGPFFWFLGLQTLSAQVVVQKGWHLIAPGTLSSAELNAWWLSQNAAHSLWGWTGTGWEVRFKEGSTQASFLSELKAYRGYWLQANGAVSLPATTTNSPQSLADFNLSTTPGWSLLGTPTQLSVTTFFQNTLPEGSTLWAWQAGAWQVFSSGDQASVTTGTGAIQLNDLWGTTYPALRTLPAQSGFWLYSGNYLDNVFELSALSDEFESSNTASAWKQIWQEEQWGFDQLETFDIASEKPGWLTMRPYTSAWYGDYRGVLAFKEIRGNFMVTTQIQVSNRSATGAPNRLYSLGGIMVRQPRQITPATWQAGGENYIFLSLGSANQPGTFQTEVKTTVNSNSVLEIEPGASEAWIRAVRLDQHFILLIRFANQSWKVHRRYLRADFGRVLQVGLTTYTDWQNVEILSPSVHNTQLITSGSPDLVARFNYLRYERPVVPSSLMGANFSDSARVSDSELLAFLGND